MTWIDMGDVLFFVLFWNIGYITTGIFRLRRIGREVSSAKASCNYATLLVIEKVVKRDSLIDTLVITMWVTVAGFIYLGYKLL